MRWAAANFVSTGPAKPKPQLARCRFHMSLEARLVAETGDRGETVVAFALIG